jgi:hypothetical protein
MHQNSLEGFTVTKDKKIILVKWLLLSSRAVLRKIPFAKIACHPGLLSALLTISQLQF